MTCASAPCDDGRTAIVSASGPWSYGDLHDDCLRLRSAAPAGAPAALHTSDAAVVAAALLALQGWSSEVHLLPTEVAADVLPAGTIVLNLTIAARRDGPGAGESSTGDASIDTTWIVYTSGTTGTPKPIRHTEASLTRTVVRSPAVECLTWGLVYDPNRMAGLQVIHQAMSTCTTVVAPRVDQPLQARVAALIEGGVDALSATPTLWRLILQLPIAAGWPLRRITLGGEIADQGVLDALVRRYPDARISHVFASTETGAAFSVTDKRAGFPLSYLTDPPRGIRLDVRDGILHVHSPGVSAVGDDGFASTGDLVEIVGDRVHFKGRVSGVVNVGGVNVWPEEVERILRTHPSVLDAAVSSKPNAFSGRILIAQVVLSDDADPTRAPKELRAWMKQRVPNAQVPATIAVVDSLEISTAGKAQRS